MNGAATTPIEFGRTGESGGNRTTKRRAVPHVRTFLADTVTPLGVYQRLRRVSSFHFLFESVSGGSQVARYSFLGAGPSVVYRLFADRLQIERFSDGDDNRAKPGAPSDERQSAPRVLYGDSLALLREHAFEIESENSPAPFAGGLVGYFGWDLVRLLEHLPRRGPDPFGLPVAVLGRFDSVVVFDHARQRVLAIANEIEGEVSAAAAQERLQVLSELLVSREEGGALPLLAGDLEELPRVEVNLDAASYRAAVERGKEYIRAGDVFQVVLARRFEIETRSEPLALYRALRMVNPSPYMVLLEMPEVALVGGSPETLVRADAERFELRPIAGSAPRGGDPQEDAEFERRMLEDPKERAEHVMLVDLGRNDLGRVAGCGGVSVRSFFEVEKYSHIMHIVSSVEAKREPGRSAFDALLACFPAGTLSGAPKVRAMEIIDELEPESRGIYGGAVGYLSFDGSMDTCIAIRTLVVQPGRTTLTAGAGIVADSDPDREEEETRNKAAALLAAVALAARLERCDDAGTANDAKEAEASRPEQQP